VTLKSEDWSNDAEKSDLHAALVSIKYCFQKQLKKAYLPQTFNLFIYSILYTHIYCIYTVKCMKNLFPFRKNIQQVLHFPKHKLSKQPLVQLKALHNTNT